MKYINLTNTFTSPFTWLQMIEQPPSREEIREKCKKHGFTPASFGGPFHRFIQGNTFITQMGYKSGGYAFDNKTELPFAVGDTIGCKHKGKVVGHLKITNIECKRVQEITISELVKLKVVPDNYVTKIVPKVTRLLFIDWFNSHYAKPEAVRENGKIVSYVCYPYSMGTMNMTEIGHYDLTGVRQYEYKGLPLTIHTNLYFAIWTGEECEKP